VGDLADDSYECDACHGVFKKGWSDAEMREEAERTFGALPAEEQALVCDDCYVRILAWARNQ